MFKNSQVLQFFVVVFFPLFVALFYSSLVISREQILSYSRKKKVNEMLQSQLTEKKTLLVAIVRCTKGQRKDIMTS